MSKICENFLQQQFLLCNIKLNNVLLSILACSRMCQNGGTLDPGTCTCSCAGGFSGANCESEYIVRYMCELIKLAENVLVSVYKLINAGTKLIKRFCIAFNVVGVWVY